MSRTCANCGNPADEIPSRRSLCAECRQGEQIEYWAEGNTVTDRNGNVVIGHLRSDGIKTEQKAQKAADMLNAGKTVAQVREWLSK